MHNRYLLRFMFLGAALFACERAEAQKEKLNILWLTCEDISPTLSFYGDSTANTPHLDRLASESLIFDNAFTTVGVCAPSRSSIITGMYPVSIGTHNMRSGRDVMGWGARSYDQESNAYDINGINVPRYAVVVPAPVKCFSEYLRAEGYYCSNNYKTDYQFAAPLSAWEANSNEAHWKNRGEDQPFFAVFNHEVTHESRMWMNKQLPMTVDPAAVPLPDYYPDNPVIRQDVARNYSNIELLDQQIGLKLQELEEAGLLDKTVIFFYSDHGGPLARGKREHYESGLRVPMLVRLPGGKTSGRIRDLISFVDLAPTVLSLAGIKAPDHIQGRAFLGPYKAENKRDFIFGSGDRFDEFPDRMRSVINDSYVYVKNFHPELAAYKDVSYRKNMDMMHELLRLRDEGQLNKEQLYWFRNTKTAEEFYDRQTDPYQLHNLIADARYSEEIEKFRQALQGWREQVGDKGSSAEMDLLKKMWPGIQQPVTEKPSIYDSNNLITIGCNTINASIVYIVAGEDFEATLDSGWQLYIKPLKKEPGKILYSRTNRIGFKDSEIVRFVM